MMSTDIEPILDLIWIVSGRQRRVIVRCRAYLSGIQPVGVSLTKVARIGWSGVLAQLLTGRGAKRSNKSFQEISHAHSDALRKLLSRLVIVPLGAIIAATQERCLGHKIVAKDHRPSLKANAVAVSSSSRGWR